MRPFARALLGAALPLALAGTSAVVLLAAPAVTGRSSRGGTGSASREARARRGLSAPAGRETTNGAASRAWTLEAPASSDTSSSPSPDHTSGRARDAASPPHARERGATSSRPAAPTSLARHDTQGVHEATAADLARIRAALRSLDARTRIDALLAARDLRSPELVPDIVLLLDRGDADATVRRLASQVLAQGDPATLMDLFSSLKQDPDPVVQLNAAYGLARGGDEVEQSYLLALCEKARGQAPTTLAVVATALEDPALRSPAVIQRFEQLAQDPRVSQATRDRATAVLKAKLGS